MGNPAPYYRLPMSNLAPEVFETLGDYVEAKGLKKNRVGIELGVSPQLFSALLNPRVYRPKVDDELAEKIAALLNQTPDYVRDFYRKAAA